MQKGLKNNECGPRKALGLGGQAVLPRLSLEGGTALLPGSAPASQTDGRTDGRWDGPRAALPHFLPAAPGPPSLGGGGGDIPGGPATPPALRGLPGRASLSLPPPLRPETHRPRDPPSSLAPPAAANGSDTSAV